MSAKSEMPEVISRIYILESGDLLVTDLWEELEPLVEKPLIQEETNGKDL